MAKKTTTKKTTTKPYVPTAAEAAKAKAQGFRMAAGASAADYAYAAAHKIDIRKSAASQNWGADNRVTPTVAPVVTPSVQTSLQGINQMPGAGGLPYGGGGATISPYSTTNVSGLPYGSAPAQTAGFQNVTGGASVTPAKSSLPTGFGGISAISGPKPSAPGFAGVTGTASVTPAPGSQPGAFTGSEPKASQFYQPPSTAGTLPGAFTGSEPKAAQYYQPPKTSGPETGAQAQQLTLADLGLQGQVNLNTLEGGRGWYLPWWNNGVQGSLDWSTGTFYPAYPLAGGGSEGGGSSGGGGDGGGGGYSSARAGGVSGGLVQWRVGT